MSEQFQRGAACHKVIDAFTDAHAVVKLSRTRLGADYRRFSAVLMDVFYDYLLARNWERYSDESLDEFTGRFYAQANVATLALPGTARAMLVRIVRRDSLGSYRTIEGVEHALRRISSYLSDRWHKPFALEQSIPLLLQHEAELNADFVEFFPQLQAHVERWMGGDGRSVVRES